MSNIKEKIRNLNTINEEAIKYCLILAEKKLLDTLETKNQLEKKIFTLLSGYMVAVVALFGISQKSVFCNNNIFNFPSILFVGGILILLIALKTTKYGTIGKNPSVFLENDEYITIDKNHLCYIYTDILCEYSKSIKKSIKNNKNKSICLNVGIIFGFFSSLLLLINLIF